MNRIVLKTVLAYAFLEWIWEVFVDGWLIHGGRHGVDPLDLVGPLASGAVVYFLITYLASRVSFPEGAVGIDAERAPPDAAGVPADSPCEPSGSHTPADSDSFVTAHCDTGANAGSSTSSERDPPQPFRARPPRVTVSQMPVLLVDDDLQFLLSAGVTLRGNGVKPIHAISDSREVMSFLAGNDVSVVLLDLDMPHLSGADLLPKIREEYPHLPVIVITGMIEIETAVACVKAGAFDYLIKPVEWNRFVSSVKRAVESRALHHRLSSLEEQMFHFASDADCAAHGIFTRSRKMKAVYRYIKAGSSSCEPVLITGETGVGKELIARAVHSLSGRPGEFVAVNVAGLDDAMISDTLFGHRKGAYTGADRPRDGLIARAADGTLFLDEIGDIPESFQVKLLRLLEEKEYYPLGSDVPRTTNARILCATHHDLEERVSGGNFRKDLFYRLAAHHVRIPPLRNRKEDIPLLVEHFLETSAASAQKRKPAMRPELMDLLSAYHFPGNVRELKAMVHDAVLQHRSGVLSHESFLKAVGSSEFSSGDPDLPGAIHGAASPVLLKERFPTLKEVDDYLVAEALNRSGNNQSAAAALLGITRSALNKRLIRKGKSQISGARETPMGHPSHQ